MGSCASEILSQVMGLIKLRAEKEWLFWWTDVMAKSGVWKVMSLHDQIWRNDGTQAWSSKFKNLSVRHVNFYVRCELFVNPLRFSVNFYQECSLRASFAPKSFFPKRLTQLSIPLFQNSFKFIPNSALVSVKNERWTFESVFDMTDLTKRKKVKNLLFVQFNLREIKIVIVNCKIFFM